MVILAAGSPLERLERHAAVGGTVHRGAHRVEDVRILRVDEDATAVSSLPIADAGILARHVLPGGTGVVGSVKPGAIGYVVAHDIHALGLGVHGDRQSDAALERRNTDLGPGQALICRFEDLCRLDRGLPGAPSAAGTSSALGRGQHDTRCVVSKLQVPCAIVSSRVEDVRPCLAAIGGPVDSASVVIGISQRRHGHEVGIGRIDEDAVDLHRIFQTDVLPCTARIDGLPHAIAEAAPDGVAGTGIYDICIRRSDLDGADAVDAGLVVEDGVPGHAAAGGLPDAALRRTDVEHASLAAVRAAVLANDAGHGGDAATVEWPDVTPLQARVEIGAHLSGRQNG